MSIQKTKEEILGEFDDKFEVAHYGGNGNRVARIFLEQALDKLQDAVVEEVNRYWNRRVKEVKEELDKTYPEEHYEPHYQGIFEDLIVYLKSNSKPEEEND